jgi:AcrR family transcriptional regulator
MDAEGTREHIVRAADELFYKQGFEHTSFADVADAVGISRGNFYYHFKTKDEILAAVIGARTAERQRLLGQWEAEQDTPAGRIRRRPGKAPGSRPVRGRADRDGRGHRDRAQRGQPPPRLREVLTGKLPRLLTAGPIAAGHAAGGSPGPPSLPSWRQWAW